MEREQLTQIVSAAQKGDSAAIGELFNTFQNTVYNIALRETKDPETAADVTQETFIEVIQTIDKLQEPAAFVTWMKTIVYHQCTRYYRKKENKHESLVEEREDAPGIFDTLEEENEEFIPDKAMENEDFRKTIRAFIDKLPDVQRSAIMMKYFDDLSVKEIAAVQGVTENTVLSRLYYGRNAIKAEVESYEKRYDTKLHAVPFLPLVRFLFNEAPKTMSKKAAVAAAKAIGSATGVHVVATVGGTAAVAGTTAAVAGGVGAAGVAAGTSVGAGIAAAVAAIPLSVKIGAGIAAAVIAIGAPLTVHQINKAPAPATETDTTITTRAEETEDEIVPGIPADALIYDGHAYKLYDENKLWDEAEDYCDALGGHLLTVNSEAEQAFLDGCLETAAKPGYWIGGVQTDNGWSWVTGEDMTYTNWDEGVPGDEACLYVMGQPRARSRQNGVGNWDTAPADADSVNFGYICEWDYAPTEETTTTTEGETTAPIEDETTAPIEGDTTAPIEDETTAPVEGETTAPIEDETTAPIEGETTAPTEGETTTPTEGETTAPTDGSTTTPTQSVTTAPTQGVTTVPTQGSTTAPTQGVTTTPTQGSTTAPTQGVIITPTQGSTTAPTQSVITVPTQSVTTAPTQGVIITPTQGSTTAPTQGVTTIPTQSVTTAPTQSAATTTQGVASSTTTKSTTQSTHGSVRPVTRPSIRTTTTTVASSTTASSTTAVAITTKDTTKTTTTSTTTTKATATTTVTTTRKPTSATTTTTQKTTTTTKATTTVTTTTKPTTTTTQPVLYTKRIDDYVFEEIGTTYVMWAIEPYPDGSVYLSFIKEENPDGEYSVKCSFNKELYTENHGLSLKAVYNETADTYDWYFVSYDQAFLNSIQTGSVKYSGTFADGELSWCCGAELSCDVCYSCENCCTCDTVPSSTTTTTAAANRCSDCGGVICHRCGYCRGCSAMTAYCSTCWEAKFNGEW